MFLQSIRWRLPLSYAAIALITVLALGGVLLAVLSGYYAQLEQNYLQERVEDIGRFVSGLQHDELDLNPTLVEGVLKLQATLADTTIRLLDMERNEVLHVSPTVGLYVLADEFSDGPPEIPVPHIEQTVEPTGEEIYVFSWPRGENLTRPPDLTAGSMTLGWLIAGGVAILLAAAVGWMVSRWLSRPLFVLTETTGRMAQGDLAVRAEVYAGGEFGTLAGSFNNMADRLEETVLTLRRFVADAAHELHTPLTALRTDLELIADEEDPAQQAVYADRAKAQIVRLETLTNSLLVLSRIEAQTQLDDAARTTLNLTGLVRERCELHASRAEQQEQVFVVEIADEPVLLLAGEAQIGRVVDNLLDNAVKFTPTGGTITLRLAAADGWAVLVVEDTGVGIPPDDLPELFSRFKRGRNVVGYPGNGLGLAIVKTIVEKHGGEVSAANTACGACFTVRLPLSTTI